MLHAGPVEPKLKDFEVIDLSREWRAHTGLPFTFLIWATRPGVLSVDEHRELNDAMHRAVKARAYLAMEQAADFEVKSEEAKRLVEENFDYYIDKTNRDGLNALFRRGYERGILPSMRYQHPMFSLLEGKAGPFHEQTIHEILTDAMQGKRICVADAVRLAEEASLADLGLAADNIRTRIVTDRTVKFVALIDHRDLNQPEALEEEASIMADQGIRHILLLPKSFRPGDLERWEQIVLRLKRKFSVEIEGFSIPMIIQAAKERGITIREVVARLVTAGLDAVPSIGGGMLIDRIHRRRAKQAYTVEEWIETAKWLHALSAKVSCFLSFDPQDSWEERMVHLHKLRSLQDLTPGFKSFHVEIAPWVKGVFPVEDYLRSLALCRLFLDNIHSVQEPSVNASSVSGALGLCFGADELHFRASDDNSDPRADSVSFLRTLWEAGIDLDQAVVKPDGDEEIIQ